MDDIREKAEAGLKQLKQFYEYEKKTLEGRLLDEK